MVSHHYQIQELFGGRRRRKFDPREVSEMLADLWMRGMRAGNGRRSDATRPLLRR